MKILFQGKAYLADEALDSDTVCALRTADAFGVTAGVIAGLIRAGLLTEVTA